MTDLTELERARINAAPDNMSVTPEQILRLALDDLRKGAVEADACIVILLSKPDGKKTGDAVAYRSCLQLAEEIAALEGQKHRAVKRWCNE